MKWIKFSLSNERRLKEQLNEITDTLLPFYSQGGLRFGGVYCSDVENTLYVSPSLSPLIELKLRHLNIPFEKVNKPEISRLQYVFGSEIFS